MYRLILCVAWLRGYVVTECTMPFFTQHDGLAAASRTYVAEFSGRRNWTVAGTASQQASRGLKLETALRTMPKEPGVIYVSEWVCCVRGMVIRCAYIGGEMMMWKCHSVYLRWSDVCVLVGDVNARLHCAFRLSIQGAAGTLEAWGGLHDAWPRTARASAWPIMVKAYDMSWYFI